MSLSIKGMSCHVCGKEAVVLSSFVGSKGSANVRLCEDHQELKEFEVCKGFKLRRKDESKTRK